MSVDAARIAHLMQQRKFAEAAAFLREAVQASPRDTGLRMQWAAAAYEGGDAPLAREQLREILAIEPGNATAAFRLALLERAAGDADAMESALRHVLKLAPQHVDSLHQLGELLRHSDRPREARALLERALSLAPERADVELELAWLDIADGRYLDAVKRADAVLGRRPDHAQAWYALGSAWRHLSAYRTSRKALQRAAGLAPHDAAIAREFAILLAEYGQYDEALAEFSRLRTLAPDNLGDRWAERLAICRFPESQAQAERAQARFARGVEQSLVEAEGFDQAAAAEAFHWLRNALPFYLHYQDIDSVATTRRFGELVSNVAMRAHPSLYAAPSFPVRGAADRLRVGFVCSQLREHTLVYYFAEWMTRLPRDEFEVFVWNLAEKADAVTAELATVIEHFHAAGGDAVLDLAAKVRASALDVLIFLDVGMEGRMQQLAALRLAPVQCVAYGHPMTTGLRNVDYYLSGAAMEPADADAHYSERLVRLPGLGVKPRRARAEAGAGSADWLGRQHGRPLLLCLQNLIKTTLAFDAALARIAAATRARIVFLEPNQHQAGTFKARLAPHFAEAGADLDGQVHIVPQFIAHANFLAGAAAADLVLDTPNFSGGRSSLDALHAGAPVVAWEGRWMRARQTAAMLRIVGAEELIAHDADGYVDLVVALCADGARRQRLRETIRANSHRLFDAPEVLPAFARFLREVAAGRRDEAKGEGL